MKKIVQVCITQSYNKNTLVWADVKKAAKGSWVMSEEVAKQIVRLEAFVSGKFMGAFEVKGFTKTKRNGDVSIQEGIEFNLKPIYGSIQTQDYNNKGQAYLVKDLTSQK
jgi:hypothetical protein